MKLRPAAFIGYLDTRLVDEFDNIHELLSPFGFYSAKLQRNLWVPVGFKTDFASVPRMIGAYLLVGGKGTRASVIHDLEYTAQRLTRAQADAVFKEALTASGYSALTVGLMWSGVRLGGASHWTAPNVPQEAHVEHEITSAQLDAA